MSEEKTVSQSTEQIAADDKAQNESGETTDGGDGDEKAGEGVDKKDYSSMSIEEIKADLAEKNKGLTSEQLIEKLAKQVQIIGHKNRAINSLKKKGPETQSQKEGEDKADDLDKPLTRRELLELNNRTAVEAKIVSVAKDEAERKAILDAYNNEIIKSGDPEKDFKKALAIANAGVVEEYKRNQSSAHENENYLTRFSGGGSMSGGESPAAKDAVKRAVEQNLQRAGYTREQIDESLKKI